MTARLVENFMNLYRDASELSHQAIKQVYAPEVVFVDPIHRIEGIDALQAYLSVMYSNVHSCQFEYQKQTLKEARPVSGG